MHRVPSRVRAELLGRLTPTCVRFVPALLALAGPALADPGPGEGVLPDDAAEDQQVVMGSLDRSVLQASIVEGLEDVREVYRRRLKQRPGLGGKIAVRFVVEGGEVVEAEASVDTIGDDELTEALLEHVRSRTYPHGHGTMIVTYPFVFAAEE